MALSELHRAVQQGDLHRVSAILSESPRRVDIDQADRKGWTPLMYALSNTETGTELLSTLIRHGATIDRASISFALDDPKKLAVLIESGADILYRTEEGYDALVDAAYSCDVLHNPRLVEVLELLIANGVPLRGMTTFSESAVRVLSHIGRFDAVQQLLKAGANPDDIRFTKLIEAVAFGTLADVATVVEGGANLEERDYWERTPWLVAIQTGDISKASFLLEHGSDRSARGRCGALPLSYAIENGHVSMLRWLLEIGVDIEQVDDFGHTALITAVESCNSESVDLLVAAGANVNHRSTAGTVLSFARTRSIAVKLMDAGADPQHLPSECRRAILGYPSEPDQDLLEASSSEFQQSRSRRFGTQNPETMNNAFWNGMIRSGIDAYQAGTLFGIEDRFDGTYTPIWCARRFGQSITSLPDGRIVQVAGEHEDSYDPDFCIYNDVFVHTPDGTVTIYGYPESVFPSTDFHTATLIGNYIYLIGSLGYPGRRRYGETPVYRLDTRTFCIEMVQTTGNTPGWIYGHRAVLSAPCEIRVFGGKILSSADGEEVYSENSKVFILNIECRVWHTE
jgi:ankyrin repeat protein